MVGNEPATKTKMGQQILKITGVLKLHPHNKIKMEKLNLTQAELEMIYIYLEYNKLEIKNDGWEKELSSVLKKIKNTIPSSKFLKVELKNFGY